MEKRMFIAVALSMLILVTWPMIFGNKNKVQNGQSTDVSSVKEEKKLAADKKVLSKGPAIKIAKTRFQERFYYIENEAMKVELSSAGAKIKQVWFKNYKNSNGEGLAFFSESVSELGGLVFSDMEGYEFIASFNSDKDIILENKAHGAKIQYSILDNNPYVIELRTSFADHSETKMKLRDIAAGSSRDYSFPVNASDRFKEYIVYTKDKAERLSIKEDNKEAIIFESRVNWLALSDKYIHDICCIR
jgi:YidC/Oxa1 family membrane protein insertase